MSVDKDLTRIIGRSFWREADGRTTTRPMLIVTDGASMSYGVNVTIAGLNGKDQTELVGVPIARANKEIFYGAEVGSPCRLRRTASGQWEVVGFSRSMPGSLTLIPVTVPPFTLGPATGTTIGVAEDRTLIVRPLTLGDLAIYGGFGITPLGALGAFVGGVMREFR
jgi:hypothetical protein